MKRLVDWLPFLLFFTILHAGCSLSFAFVAYLHYKSADATIGSSIATILLSPLVEVMDLFGYHPEGFWLLLPNSFIWALSIVAFFEWCVHVPREKLLRRGFPVETHQIPTDGSIKAPQEKPDISN